jgi:hypothetical protein
MVSLLSIYRPQVTSEKLPLSLESSKLMCGMKRGLAEAASETD